jgi:hypothetical protein
LLSAKTVLPAAAKRSAAALDFEVAGAAAGGFARASADLRTAAFIRVHAW